MSSFQDKVVYQIYPKSFQDTNGDGIGDLKGIIERLDYLKELGVDYLWLTPFFVSPQKDNGYDVEDYRKIDSRFGTMKDLELLIEEAKKRNIYLMFDMVFNHTSTEHEWFQKALKNDPKYKEYYIWKDPKEDGSAPTNWQSKFGGPAWKYIPELDQYYLHLFDESQADLNWENPDVMEECADIVRFWLEKGVKGFRFDVINLISKGAFEDDPNEFDGRQFYSDGPRIHEFLNRLNQMAFPQDDPLFITVGEMNSTNIEACKQYTNPDNHELTMAFSFFHLKVDYKDKKKWTTMDFDFSELKEILFTWQMEMQEHNGWNALFLNCHDQPRSLSRFGDDKNYPKESAKMLATAIQLMRGTPYIYQGEEIGMTNANFTKKEQYKDVESTNSWEFLRKEGKSEAEICTILQAKSRDNARTPMQWDDSKYAGFSDQEPWIAVNPNKSEIHVKKNLEENDSIFHYYQRLIRLRKEHQAISSGTIMPLLEDDEQIFAYKRESEEEEIVVLCNFYAGTPTIGLSLDGYECLLSNVENSDRSIMKPYEASVWAKKK